MPANSLLSSDLQPGYEYQQVTLRARRYEVPSAVPVFIGFTEKVPLPSPARAVEGAMPQPIADLAEFQQLFGAAPMFEDKRSDRCGLYYTLRHYFDNGGLGCFVCSVGTFSEAAASAVTDLPERLSGGDLFARIDRIADITLVAIPDLALFADDEAAYLQTAWANALAACECYPRLFAVLDAPRSLTGALACSSWLQDALPDGASHGAAWWPWLLGDYAVDRSLVHSTTLAIAPCGVVCAQIQLTDRNIGVWKAPANGPDIKSILKPEYGYRDGERLFSADGVSINLIRSFIGRGTKLWGCRTLARPVLGDPGLYVQTRRLATYIQNNLRARAAASVFEPNNEITWLMLKSGLGMWLRRLWQSGGLAGQEEELAYQVQIGVGESMTREDVIEGRLLINVLVALYYPAEFIRLTVTLNMNDVPDTGESRAITSRSTLP